MTFKNVFASFVVLILVLRVYNYVYHPIEPLSNHRWVTTPSVVDEKSSNAANTSVPAKWHLEIMNDSSKYSKGYWMKECFIYVYRDGSGIEISAMNPNFFDFAGRPVHQTIIIKKDKDGIVHFDDGVNHHLREVSNIEDDGASYDVFDFNYRQEAKLLPSDVKKLFLGQYGIE